MKKIFSKMAIFWKKCIYIDENRGMLPGDEPWRRSHGTILRLALCATFFSLGYVFGKHDSKTQK
ncbi:MAG: hypothetical protein E7307_08565 [Butyrivibrio sp.]|nr:hypothetical protein [Butyrivibrio sp.]